MDEDIYFEYLSESHIDLIKDFVCEDEPSIKNFLIEDALGLQKSKSAITRLYFNSQDELIGFFTLYNDLVEILKPKLIKEKWDDFPKGISEFPSIRLHYLGVDSRYRNKDYGKYLFAEIVEIASDISITSGCNFITVEALESALWFYQKYSFVHLGYSGKHRKMALRFEKFYVNWN
ncbi:GNAT family N-acetyltransferase [Paenibacillus sp. FSL L8-0506]|uniref:GNAT family N-acetyltransferase n=1 Tax=Paenibacillus sp. FSL L8-0506 TaxID=2975335 RepID=UPI0030FA354C